MQTYARSDLGEFNSIVCFKAVITGMEEMLGEKATAIALTAAGRTRGADLCQSLGLAPKSATTDDLGRLAAMLDEALGEKGTRLCKVERIESDGETIQVYTTETVCSAGEEIGSPRKCTFTMGAIQGALQYMLGTPMRARHIESVLRGGTHDIFELTPR